MGKNGQNAALDAILKKAGGKSGKGKKGRKIGRYSKHPSSCRYRAERRWETNRVKRVMRHVRRLPGDLQARQWLANLDTAEASAFLASVPIPKAA